MTTFEFRISLPDKLRQEAEKAGLLMPKAIEQLLREEIRRRRADNFFVAADRLAALDLPAMTDAEVESEIQKARKPNAA